MFGSTPTQTYRHNPQNTLCVRLKTAIARASDGGGGCFFIKFFRKEKTLREE